VKYISIKEAAQLLKVHENTITGYIRKGLLTPYRVVAGGKIRLDEKQVRGLLKPSKK